MLHLTYSYKKKGRLSIHERMNEINENKMRIKEVVRLLHHLNIHSQMKGQISSFTMLFI